MTSDEIREQMMLLAEAQRAGLVDGDGPADVAEVIVITGAESSEGGE